MVRQRTASTEVRLARGGNLARLRARRGLTLLALGEKVGVSAEQVRKYQIGRDFLSASWCWRFAKALDCSFGDLFNVEPADGVAEEIAPFTSQDDERLDEVLTIARSQLTGHRRNDLRDILLDVLEEQGRAGA